jgi:hypothetical protein
VRWNEWLLAEDGITDEIAIQVAVEGLRPVRLTLNERRIVARRYLSAEGSTVKGLWQRLHVDPRTATALAREVRSEEREVADASHA